MKNEAARLFFAVSALILVGMLTAPTGGKWERKPEEISPARLMSSVNKNQQKNAKTIKLAERKTSQKKQTKKS